jgi:hypothetical protein
LLLLAFIVVVSIRAVRADSIEATRVLLPIDDDAKMQIGDMVQHRNYQYAVGVVFDDMCPTSYNLSGWNEYTAVRNRIVCLWTKPVDGAWDQCYDAINITQVNGKCVLPPITMIVAKPFEDWVQHFESGRRHQYINARMKLLGEGREINHAHGMREVIVKRELLPNVIRYDALMEGQVTIDADPRAVSDTDIMSQLLLGPWMSNASEFMSNYWDHRGNVCYAAGMTSEDVGNWFDHNVSILVDVIAIELDYRRFDRSVSTDAIEVEWRLYDILGIPAVERSVLHAQMYTRGMTKKARHYYEIAGTRKSGDPNTSLGNSYLNALCITYAMVRAHVPVTAWRLILMGDDALLLIHRAYRFACDVIKGVVSDLGLVFSKFHVRDNLHFAEFCSKLFWPVEDGYVLGPKVGRAISKMGWTLHNTKDPLARMRGVVLGQWPSWSFLPPLQQIGGRILALTHDVRVAPVVGIYSFVCKTEHNATSETVAMYEERYGWPWDSAMTWANMVADQIRELPCRVVEPVARFFAIDI